MPPSPLLPRTRVDLAALLEARGLRLRKRHGQSFLVEPALADAIVGEAGIGPNDAVVEVGPGAGALTQPLLAVAHHVTAIELDRGLGALLRDFLGTEPRLDLVEGDALDRAQPTGLHPEILAGLTRHAPGGAGHVVANLPYSVGTAVVARLLQLTDPPASVTGMLQREVVGRLRAEPGSRDYGPLAVLVALHGGARVLRRVARDVFLPRPDIESAVFRIEPQRDAIDVAMRAADLARQGFAARRKRVARTLADIVPAAAWEACAVPADARPEHVSPAQWARLADLVRGD